MLLNIMIVGIIFIVIGMIFFQNETLKIFVRIIIPIGFIIFISSFSILVVKNLYILLFIIVYTIFFFIYGKRHYKKIKITEIKLKTPKKIGMKNKEMKIVFLSDFHFDIRRDDFIDEHFTRLIEKVNNLEYDILLLGGDYINYEVTIDRFFERLKEINKPALGTYAVTGNHDYCSHEKVLNKFRDHGIIVVNNDFIKVNDELNLKIFGVEDTWEGNPSIDSYRQRIHENNYNILLSHHPDFISYLPDENQVDFMLSGHYHGGQVNYFLFPIYKLVTRFGYGHYHKNNTHLYTGSGVGGTVGRGMLGQRLRYLSTSEIVHIKIEEDVHA